MSKILYPHALKKGDSIAVTACSSGVDDPSCQHRMQTSIQHLQTKGYKVEEGSCLYENTKQTSGTAQQRADEFERFWMAPDIAAIFPPWGGELLLPILPILPFEKFKTVVPKWLMGYSDTSTLLFALTTQLNVATMHSINLMDAIPSQTDTLSLAFFEILQQTNRSSFTQASSSRYQKKWVDFSVDPLAPFDLTEPTQWKSLQSQKEVFLEGRVIGGCMDTLKNLIGTPYGDLPRWSAQWKKEKVILYLENCEMKSFDFCRALWNMKLAGWFENLSGILLGRSSVGSSGKKEDFQPLDALQEVFASTSFPVLYDVDIGHVPPQMTLVNGSFAEVHFQEGKAWLKQTLC